MSEAGTLHDGTLCLDRASVRAARRPIGPVRIGDDRVLLRPARWTDGPAWRATRRREADHLRNAFGSAEGPGRHEHSLTTWVEHLSAQRRAARAGLQAPYLLLHTDGRVIGEVVAHLDPASGSVEASVWVSAGTPHAVVTWATAGVMLRLFSLPTPVPRVVAPIAVTNEAPRRLLALFGFVPVGRAREYRPYGGELVDHDIWWLDRSDEHLARLAQAGAAPPA